MTDQPTIETLRERQRWYADDCPHLDDLAGYQKTGLSFDAAVDLATAIRLLEAAEARVAVLQQERQPTYGNGRCRCGHLSDRHACDRDNSDTACFDCDCGYFKWDGTPIPLPVGPPSGAQP